MVRLKRVLLPETSLVTINNIIPEGVQLEKRSGIKELFLPTPVFTAIHKAMMATTGDETASINVYEEATELTKNAVTAIMKRVESFGTVHQEDVQDQVELI